MKRLLTLLLALLSFGFINAKNCEIKDFIVEVYLYGNQVFLVDLDFQYDYGGQQVIKG